MCTIQEQINVIMRGDASCLFEGLPRQSEDFNSVSPDWQISHELARLGTHSIQFLMQSFSLLTNDKSWNWFFSI